MENNTYIISELVVENYKCIDSGNFRFDEKNLVVLDGPNGYGKTTLFDAIEIVLTGKPRRIKDNHNILANYSYNDSPIHKDRTKSILLELLLKSDSKDIIRISRKFDPAPDQRSIRNNPQKIYQESTLDIFLNNEKLDTSVRDILRFSKMDLFGVLNYVEQDENTFFLKKNPKEKYKDLAVLLGVEKQLRQLQLLAQFLKKTLQKIEDYKKEKEQIEEDNKNLTSDTGEQKYKRLLTNVIVIWDTEDIVIGEIDTQNSFLRELDRIEYLRLNSSVIDTVKLITKLNTYLNDDNFLNELTSFYWVIKNIKIIESEFNRRKEINGIINENTKINEAIEKYEYDKLLEKDTLKKLGDISELKNQIERYSATISLIKTLIESLSTENKILEELKNRRTSLIQFTEQFSDLINLSDSECPTCGFDWVSNEELLRQIEVTEDKIFKSYNANNLKLEEEKKKLQKLFLSIFKSNLQKQSESLEKELRGLVSFELYELIKAKEITLNSKIEEFLTLFEEDKRLKLLSYCDQRIVEKSVIVEIKKIIESVIPQIDTSLKISQIESDFKKYFDDDKKGLSNISKLDIENKKDYIRYLYYNSINKRLEVLTKKIDNLIAIQKIVDRIKTNVDQKIKTYVGNIIKAISIPFYIYTGKILQEHSLGSGLIFDADINNSEPQIKIKPLNREQEASYTLSSGQLSATVISLMLVLNKVYNTSDFGTILIDDPIQTLDEINTHSLIEVLKHNFSDQQVIISTHEDRYSKFIRYKYDKFGLSTKNINMKDLYQ